jgi:sirohydrochlorin ferrochelatase
LAVTRRDIDVRAAWLDPPDRLDDVVAAAAAEGYRRIAVVPFGIADSMYLDRAKRSVDDLGLAAVGVRIAYSAPLWSRSGVARSVADRVLSSIAPPDRSATGVVLVGHGQPWQWDRDYPAGSEHETYFAQRVRSLLVEEGFGPELVRIGWLDWQDPGVSEAVRHLVAFGCRRVLVVPAAMPVETLGTLIDLRGAAEEAVAGTHVRLDVLPAWGDHPGVVAAVADAAVAAIQETID